MRIPCQHTEACDQVATIACFSCNRPICDEHTRVIPTPAPDNEADTVHLELCEPCTAKFELSSYPKSLHSQAERTAEAIVNRMLEMPGPKIPKQ
jgi:hypothetical protein